MLHIFELISAPPWALPPPRPQRLPGTGTPPVPSHDGLACQLGVNGTQPRKALWQRPHRPSGAKASIQPGTRDSDLAAQPPPPSKLRRESYDRPPGQGRRAAWPRPPTDSDSAVRPPGRGSNQPSPGGRRVARPRSCAACTESARDRRPCFRLSNLWLFLRPPTSTHFRFFDKN